MGAKSQTIGFWYYMSLLSGLCRGPIDEFVEIQVADKQAWTGSIKGNEFSTIYKPNLFGGSKKEGGISGTFFVGMGYADQVYPPGYPGSIPDLKASIGDPNVSELRGVVSVWFDGALSAMNPYLKEWRFRVRRAMQGWHGDTPWYPEKARIVLSSDTLASMSKGTTFKTSLIGTTLTITVTKPGTVGDTITVNGSKFELVGNDEPENTENFRPGATAIVTAQKLTARMNIMSETLGIFAEVTGNVITVRVAANEDGAIHAMNPAHIIYEACTNPVWGRGLPVSKMGEDSFVYAANKFCEEGFGLCIAWYRKEDISVFIKKVCDLAGCAIYTNRETGQIDIRLIRDDYNVEDLPLFTPESGLVSIKEDTSASSSTAYNEIIGTSKSPINNLDIQARAQNLASFQAQRAIASLDQDYKGIPTKHLLGRVVARDLRANAAGLKKYVVVLDRSGWKIAPGMPFRVGDPTRGIATVVLRAGEIDDGNMVDNRITIKAAQDVFGLPETSFITPVDNAWTPPNLVAAPSEERRLIEAGYRDLYLNVGESQAQAAADGTAYIGQLALAPNPTSYQYELASKAEGEADYADRATGSFTGNATLKAAAGPLDTVLAIEEPKSFDAANVGEALLIGDEVVSFEAYDEAAGTITVKRGTADTIPQSHAAGARVWTLDDDLVSDERTYTEGETVFTKVQTRTASDLLALEDAPEDSIVLVARHERPYPPADVRVDGVSVFTLTGLHPEPVLSWVSRNRITQADHLVGHGEPVVLGEEGQTYTIRVYNADDDVLVRTVTGITELTWTYTTAMSAEDGVERRVRFELESERGGRSSWQAYRFVVEMVGGWGYNWGYNWGGGS